MNVYHRSFLWLLATSVVSVTQMVNLIDFNNLTRDDIVGLVAAFFGTMGANLAALLDIGKRAEATDRQEQQRK